MNKITGSKHFPDNKTEVLAEPSVTQNGILYLNIGRRGECRVCLDRKNVKRLRRVLKKVLDT